MGIDSECRSVDGLITLLYQSISFPPGGKPNWDAIRTIMLPGAQLTKVASPDPSGNDSLSVDSFIELSTAFLQNSELREKGFEEVEIMRHTESFGRIAHIFSTYESRFFGEKRAFARGTNSIQLLKKEGRWWLVNILWDEEGPDRVIPKKYLPSDYDVKTVSMED